MTIRQFAAALIAASVISLSACAAPDPFADIPVFDVDAPEVEVLSTGEGAKHVLTYKMAPNDSEPVQDTTVRTSYGVEQQAVATDKVSADAPAGGDVQQATLPLSATAAEDGATTLTVGEAKHSDLDVGKEALTAEGFQLRWTADPAGRIFGLQLLPPDGSSDEGRAAVERALLQIVSTMPVFPDEPVGIGATWTATSRTMGETRLERTTTYTLAAVDGDTVELSLDIEAEPTTTELTLDEGDTLIAEQWNTTSDASITVDLTAPLPVTGQNAATTRIIYAGPNSQFKVVQDLTTATTYGV